MIERQTVFQVPNALAPSENVGPRYLPKTLDFSSVGEISFDLVQEEMAGTFNLPQCMFVDNTDNDAALVFVFAGTGYKLTVPAHQSGIYPIFANGQVQVTATTTPDAGLDEVQIAFVNVPMPLNGWGPVTLTIGTVTATFTPTTGAYADHSGNTSAGASAALFAANTDAIRRQVINPPTNAESIFINFGGVAASASTVPIAPGQTYDTGTGPIDVTAWTIFSVNVVPYIAKEMEP